MDIQVISNELKNFCYLHPEPLNDEETEAFTIIMKLVKLYKCCKTCNVIKHSHLDFEPNRKTCKACRHVYKKNMYTLKKNTP